MTMMRTRKELHEAIRDMRDMKMTKQKLVHKVKPTTLDQVVKAGKYRALKGLYKEAVASKHDSDQIRLEHERIKGDLDRMGRNRISPPSGYKNRLEALSKLLTKT